MSRSCTICQHVKRAEIDRRLANGEPAALIAHAYKRSESSVHRHRKNCLKLASSNLIKKEAAQGSAAVALLPSKENLSAGYLELRDRLAEIATTAQKEGSLKVALSGLNFARQTLDSLARLAGHTQAGGTQINVAVQTNVNTKLDVLVERLIQRFDQKPEIKAEIAQAFREMDNEQSN
jgi:hypothetical protein